MTAAGLTAGVSALRTGVPAAALHAPMARREWSGQRDFTRLFEEVKDRLGIEPVIATATPSTTPAKQGNRN